MLRKVFGGAVLFSVTGAILFGGVFAWKTSESVTGSAKVGSQSFELHQDKDFSAKLLGPNGAETTVMKLKADLNGDFSVKITGGTVDITHVTGAGNGDATVACGTGAFAGHVKLETGESHPTDYVLTKDHKGSADIFARILVEPAAPTSCMKANVEYKVTVNGENANINPS